jgi:energy-converting hydrogenase A subunit M
VCVREKCMRQILTTNERIERKCIDDVDDDDVKLTNLTDVQTDQTGSHQNGQ